MRATFEQSWRLLAPAEQRALAALSVFAGRFSRAAALAVAGARIVLLSSLVDKSLLQVDRHGRTESRRRSSSIRCCAISRAPRPARSTSAATCARATPATSAQWLADTEQALRGPEQPQALAALEQLLPDCQAAWSFAVAQRDAPFVERATLALMYYFEARGRRNDGIALFSAAERALDADGGGAAAALAMLARALSTLRYRGGEMAMTIDTRQPRHRPGAPRRRPRGAQGVPAQPRPRPLPARQNDAARDLLRGGARARPRRSRPARHRRVPQLAGDGRAGARRRRRGRSALPRGAGPVPRARQCARHADRAQQPGAAPAREPARRGRAAALRGGAAPRQPARHRRHARQLPVRPGRRAPRARPARRGARPHPAGGGRPRSPAASRMSRSKRGCSWRGSSSPRAMRSGALPLAQQALAEAMRLENVPVILNACTASPNAVQPPAMRARRWRCGCSSPPSRRRARRSGERSHGSSAPSGCRRRIGLGRASRRSATS